MRITRLIGALATLAVLVPGPAGAGGWWTYIDLNGKHFAAGDSVTARTEVLFSSIDEAERVRESGEFFAYLMSDVDDGMVRRAMSRPQPDHWWAPPDELILVGDVELTRWNSNLARATADITVPEDLAPGKYDLMFCDRGCATPLADVVPSAVNISDDVLAARTARIVAGLKERVHVKIASLRNEVRSVARGLKKDARTDRETSATIRALSRRLDSEPQPSTPWAAFAGWFAGGIAAACLAFVIRSRRSITRRGSDLVFPDEIPDDPRELIETR